MAEEEPKAGPKSLQELIAQEANKEKSLDELVRLEAARRAPKAKEPVQEPKAEAPGEKLKAKASEKAQELKKRKREKDRLRSLEESKTGRNFFATKQKAPKKPLALGIAAGVMVIGGAAVLNPWTGLIDYGSGDEKPAGVANPNSTSDKPPVEWYEEAEVPLPVSVPEWQTTEAPYNAEGLGEEQLENSQEVLEATTLLGVTEATLGGEANGYTSSVEEALNEDGTPNPYFSYVTSELFLNESTDIVNRLINPVYGNWTPYQFASNSPATNFEPSVLGDIFSSGYVERNFSKPDKSYLPVFADWAGNDYGLGGSLLPQGVRWVGEVQDAQAFYEYDREALNYVTTATYQVRYTAWTTEREKVTKDGTLTLKFVVDTDAGFAPGAFRIKVDEASLSLS